MTWRDMKEQIKVRVIEELQKQLAILFNKINSVKYSYKEWEKWKKDKTEISFEEIEEIGKVIADTLCELEAEENEPFYMKAWRYLPPMAYKQLEEMSNDKGAGQCGHSLPLAGINDTSKPNTN